jgi:hypothetical protein
LCHDVQPSRLAQPERAQNEHHDDDETDEIDDAVHGVSPRPTIYFGLCAFALDAFANINPAPSGPFHPFGAFYVHSHEAFCRMTLPPGSPAPAPRRRRASCEVARGLPPPLPSHEPAMSCGGVTNVAGDCPVMTWDVVVGCTLAVVFLTPASHLLFFFVDPRKYHLEVSDFVSSCRSHRTIEHQNAVRPEDPAYPPIVPVLVLDSVTFVARVHVPYLRSSTIARRAAMSAIPARSRQPLPAMRVP